MINPRYQYLIEKLAFAKKNNPEDIKDLTFDDVTDPQVKRELQLLKNVVLYNDYIAEAQLVAAYGGQIQNIINKHRAKDVVGYEAAFQRAVSALKQYIKSYDFGSYKNNKPITYFTGNIMKELDKFVTEKNSQKIVSMSDDLNQNKNLIYNAESILTSQLGRIPTPNETLNFIKNDMKYGKGLTLDKINRIKGYETKELSGLSQIGKENADGAESLSFEDVAVKGKDIGNLVNRAFNEDKLIDAIREYTEDKSDRKLLMLFLGLGEFRMSPEKGDISAAASKMGYAYYPSRKAIKGFYKYCKEKGVI